MLPVLSAQRLLRVHYSDSCHKFDGLNYSKYPVSEEETGYLFFEFKMADGANQVVVLIDKVFDDMRPLQNPISFFH